MENSPPLPKPWELLPGQVDVWLVDVSQAMESDRANRFADLLSPSEKEKVFRYKKKADRDCCLVSRVLTRWCLSLYEDNVPGDWRLDETKYGKPFAANTQTGLCFNLAHSGRLAGLAMARGMEVGLDLERIDRKVDRALVGRRMFTEKEIREMEGLDEAGQKERFFDLWTAKEAVTKAVGLGGRFGFQRVSVGFESITLRGLEFDLETGEDSAGWRLVQWTPMRGFRAAVAAKTWEDVTVRVRLCLPLAGPLGTDSVVLP